MELSKLKREDVKDLADNGRVFGSGEEYAQTGRIFRFSAMPSGITARVYGSYGDYTVTVTADVKTHCTCPYDGTVCKHVVAVLLHYLDGGYAGVAEIRTEVPSALEQTVERMPDDDLRALVLGLVRDNLDVRRAVLENVEIAPVLLRGQPTDAKQVRALKKAVDKAFAELDGNGYEYEEGEVDIDLDFVFDSLQSLHPDDQTETLWYVVTQANKFIEDYDFNTGFLERAVTLYGVAVARLERPAEENRGRLDILMDALHWDMCGYGDVSEALHEALDTVAADPEEARYLIQKLQNSPDAKVRDWAIRLYRRAGDDAGYLEARKASLHTEAQHVELADFFTAQGKPAEAQATLEAWITARTEPSADVHIPSRPDPTTGRGEIVRRLLAHYTQTRDNVSLCRILMVQAKEEGVTLTLYKQVQAAAEKAGDWAEQRPALITLSRGIERARIILFERDFSRAIAFARLPGTEERVVALVADGVKEDHPDEALALYDGLVQANIRQFNRQGYKAAARYASEVKRIYLSIVKDPEMAAQYIAGIRNEHSRRPALREEFAGL